MSDSKDKQIIKLTQAVRRRDNALGKAAKTLKDAKKKNQDRDRDRG